MNRQDAKDAKEIESLEKVVIRASMGYELQELTGPAGARPQWHAQKLGPETYTHTAKRYTFTYTMMRRVRVRVRRVADPSDHGLNRNRNRFLPQRSPRSQRYKSFPI
ncbi:MAG: hypothetical protein ACOX52_16105 [Verrucomicrobiota bacterium]